MPVDTGKPLLGMWWKRPRTTGSQQALVLLVAEAPTSNIVWPLIRHHLA